MLQFGILAYIYDDVLYNEIEEVKKLNKARDDNKQTRKFSAQTVFLRTNIEVKI